MEFRLLFAALFVAVIVSPSRADDANSEAILKAIQGLSNKVDGLQQDVDKLKGQDQSTPKLITGKPAPAPVVSTSATKGESVPGWLINVVPGDDVSKDAVATFSGPASEFNFGLHTRYVGAKNEFAYRGVAFFHPDQAGRYTFVVEIDPLVANSNTWTGGFNCEASFKIGDNIIASGQSNYQGINTYGVNFDKKGNYFKPQAFSGGADLESVDYKVSFVTNCYIISREKGEILDTAFGHWQDNKFSILVKSPDDEKARSFGSNELFHIGKAKKS